VYPPTKLNIVDGCGKTVAVVAVNMKNEMNNSIFFIIWSFLNQKNSQDCKQLAKLQFKKEWFERHQHKSDPNTGQNNNPRQYPEVLCRRFADLIHTFIPL
jgi:hypothetical protein